MGIVYLKDKPEADSFSYAYVEDADGKLVKVAVASIKSVLGINEKTNVNVTMWASNWVVSDDNTYYTQELTIDEITEKSKVDLNPTPEQIVQLTFEDVNLFVVNDNGSIKAYSINGKPSIDMTFNATVTEVM